MLKTDRMSHRRQRLIIAPESPPATPPREGGPGWPGHHHHTQHYQPTHPRAIVERSTFALPNQAALTGRAGRHSSRHSSYTNSSSPRRTPNPSSMGTPVFKFEEDLQPHPFTSSRGSHHRRSGKVGSLRRSESLEYMPYDDDQWHGRYSESEPPKASGSGLHGMASSPQHGSSSTSRRSVEFPRTGRRPHMPPTNRSAPIQIPSRKKQEEERRRKRAAAEKAREVAMEQQRANSQAARSAAYRARRSIQSDTKYGLHYSSSDESDGYPSRH